MPSISIASPAYNEAECIKSIVMEWDGHLKNSPLIDDYEIIVCDDGSKDKTLEILTELKNEMPNLVVETHVTNRGAAAALNTSIVKCQKEWVLLLDSDGQFPIENLDKMLQVIEPATEAVIGARGHKIDTFFSRFGAWLTTFLCNLVNRTALKDYSCIFKLVKRETLQNLNQEATGMNSSTELTCLLVENNHTIEEVPIIHIGRETSKSSLAGFKCFRYGLQRLAYIFYYALRRSMFILKILEKF